MKNIKMNSFIRILVTISILMLLINDQLNSQEPVDDPSQLPNLIKTQNPAENYYILTPKPLPTPRINGAKIFGVRPGHPFLYTIPATGERPIIFSAVDLPEGLKLDKNNGRISGSVTTPGTYKVKLKATNKLGSMERDFKICVGDRLSLTPPMGWNSYNVYGIRNVNQEAIEKNAQALVTSGLINHGWSYVNVDGGWQGYHREGPFNGIVADTSRFPDMIGLIKYVHDLGLKFGIYHMAYKNSYDKRMGASSDDPSGSYTRYDNVNEGRQVGKYLFHWNDAQQFASWGVDYLKYDWWIRDLPRAIDMSDALKNVNRDIIYSVCNGAGFTNGYFIKYPEAKEHASGLSYISNLWRSGSDTENSWQSVVANGFTQFHWKDLTGPGHWNDPDMLLIGWTGWGNLKLTSLTPDEQYSHITLWSLLAAPLILGCDLTKLDDFTLNLITNDEVIEVDQDALGKMGNQTQLGPYTIALVKDLEDGSKAVGFFNLGPKKEKLQFILSNIGIHGKQKIRDIWRQKDLGDFENVFPAEINSHGVIFLKMSPVKD
jgi:alpha-galactosidase